MKTIEELSKDFESLESSVSVMKKDFELKLDSAKKDTAEWKSIAEKNAADAKKFKEDAEKAEADKKKAYQEARIKEVKSFLDKAVESARITPAARELAEKLMESMTSDAIVYTFEQKDGSKTTHTQLSLFKEFIASLKQSKVFHTLTTQHTKQAATAPLSTDDGGQVRTMAVKKDGATQELIVDDYDLGVQAMEYQQEQRKIGRVIDYGEALIAVAKIRQTQE